MVFRGVLNAPRAHFAAGLAAGAGAEDMDALLLQDQLVLLGRLIRPHLLVHGRGDRHRGAGGQAQGGEQVVAVAVGQAGEEIRRGRSDRHQVRPAGQLDVAHGGLGARVQQIGVHRVPGQRLHGKRRDELAGALRHDHAYFGAGVLQPADQIRALVGGNASGDTEEDPFIDQSLHAVIPYSILGCG